MPEPCEIFRRLRVVPEKTNENTIQLTDGTYAAVGRRNWKGKNKTWLLTEFGPESARPAAGRTIDIPGNQAVSGGPDDKAIVPSKPSTGSTRRRKTASHGARKTPAR
ncbi:MAG: hypothetical protein HUU41_19720 [Bryobacteraceae bacterium]|nr:hypothetical protein [Bryobacterales bacterium]MEB2360050.1 hypothetical protein [Bryobacterales bacterium]NUN03341.1 hypothetical protein [Bryobacteraceae bacterium]